MDMQEAKRLILNRMPYNTVAQRLGVTPLKLYAELAKDPDIVAAKASGKLASSKRYGSKHFSKLPHVIDVLQNGLTQKEAAEKHGKFPSQVSRDVKKALEEGAGAATQSKATPDVLAGSISSVSTSVAQAVASGHSKEDVLKAVLGAL
jgi:hypothetical protein